MFFIFLPSLNAETVYFKDFLKLVKLENGDLKSYKEYSIAESALKKSAYWPNNPSIELERMDLNGKKVDSFYIKQEIENPLKLSAKNKGASKRYDLSKYALLEKERQILYFASLAVLKLDKAKKNKAVYERLLEVLKVAASSISADYISSKRNLKDYSQIEIKIAKMENLIRKTDSEIFSAKQKLKSFLSSQSDENLDIYPLDEEIDFKANKAELEEKLKINNATILKFKVLSDLAKIDLDMASYQRYPDFMLGYKKRYRPSDETGQDVMIGFSLPLFFTKNNALVFEKKNKKRSAEELYLQELANVLSEMREAVFEAENLEKNLNSYKNKIIPLAKANMDFAVEALKSFDGDLLSFLYVLDEYISLEIQYNDELEQFYSAKFKIEFLLGEPI